MSFHILGNDFGHHSVLQVTFRLENSQTVGISTAATPACVGDPANHGAGKELMPVDAEGK